MGRRLPVAHAFAVGVALAPGLATGAAPSMPGFSDSAAAAERALEARFDGQISAAAIGERLKRMSAEPNQVGSPHDRANAEFTLEEFRRWGWDARIEVFHALYPRPKSQLLEMTAPERFTATLTEPPIPGDPSTDITSGVLQAYVAFGGDGEVTAPLVYVNYGLPADYQALQRMGVSVKGKIVIARYGGGWRGLKPKLAEEHGAVGALIYSDPADDGYGPGLPYPEGAFRPEHGVQRGSVLDVAVRPGDPARPIEGTTSSPVPAGAERPAGLVNIPVLPISWGDARHLLAALTGPVAPRGWRGALPITYRVGPAAEVHMAVRSDWKTADFYDVIAVIRGAERPDEWIVRGNHRDGWVFGAEDPLSGQTALMEEAKAIGALAAGGWRPKRTIVYASWDGEEPGLIGSTAWAEAHAAELQSKAALYINSDGNNRGFFNASASYSTERLIDSTAADQTDPETGADVRRRALAALSVRALAPDADEGLRARAERAHRTGAYPVSDLGSGSDYTPFVQHLGVAAIDVGYGGEGQSGGVYHSAYDTFAHFNRFGDPGFVYGAVLAKTVGALVLRAADADLLPYRFTNLATAVAAQEEEIKKLLTNMRQRTEAQNRLLDDKAFALEADPTLPWGLPDRDQPVPVLDFTPLDKAIARLTQSAQAYDLAAEAAAVHPDPARLAAADALLIGVEHTLTDPAGLPGRPWYKHLVSSPGVLTGYAAKTLPAVREAVEGRRWAEAADGVTRTAKALDATASALDSARTALAQ